MLTSEATSFPRERSFRQLGLFEDNGGKRDHQHSDFEDEELGRD
jgi:hypothetical protein